MDFILESLCTPEAFLTPEVMNNSGPFAVVEPLADQQQGLLDGLLAGSRYKLLQEEAILDPDNAYPLVDYLSDIQAGLFEELGSEAPQINPLRRQLKRYYLATVTSQLAAFEGEAADPLAGLLGDDPTLGYLLSKGQRTDLRAAAHFNLAQLAEEIEAALPNVTMPPPKTIWPTCSTPSTAS